MATKKTTTSKQLVIGSDGKASVGTVTFNSKGQVVSTSSGSSSGSTSTKTSSSSSSGGSSSPSVNYNNLVNANGTIYNTATGKGYSTPEQLAADLGVSSSQINWNAISTGSAPSSGSPSSSQPSSQPSSGSVNYNNLVNANGTIYNTATGKGYSTPAQLAADLGISESQINWNSIKTGSAPSSNPSSPPQSAINYSNLINDNGTIYNTVTGKGYSTPAQLATDLGISESQINWSSIKTGNAPTSQTQQPTTPPQAVTNYNNLVNKNGTIYDTVTGKGYATPDELAKDLGVSSSQINWNAIRPDNNYAVQQPVPDITEKYQPAPMGQDQVQGMVDQGSQVAGQAYQEALSQEYAKRPDLQALYNPDGSAKNPNAPEIQGIPTLQDWGAKYGVNESPAIKAAYEAQNQQVDQPLDPAQALENIDPLKNPVDYVSAVYDQVYEKLGIATLKDQIEQYNKDILDLKNEKTDKMDEINNNPWYTEGRRVNELRRLDEKYSQKEANLQGYLQIASSLYNTGLSQANAMITDVQQLQTESRKYAQELVDGRYKLANGMPFYKYPGSSLVYSTATGTGLSYEQYIALGGDPGFGNIFEIQPQSAKDERTLVLDMAKQYDDAGILPSDSLAVAQSKMLLSPTYLKSIATKKGSGSGGGGSGPRINPSTNPANPANSNTKWGLSVTAFDKANTADNIRRWLLSNWHKNAGKPYYNVWGAAIDELQSAGVPITDKIDKIFWDVLRPGEYDQHHNSSSGSSSSSSSDDLFDNPSGD